MITSAAETGLPRDQESSILPFSKALADLGVSRATWLATCQYFEIGIIVNRAYF